MLAGEGESQVVPAPTPNSPTALEEPTTSIAQPVMAGSPAPTPFGQISSGGAGPNNNNTGILIPVHEVNPDIF